MLSSVFFNICKKKKYIQIFLHDNISIKNIIYQTILHIFQKIKKNFFYQKKTLYSGFKKIKQKL